MRAFIPKPIKPTTRVCNGLCKTQTKYKTANKRKNKDQFSRWCSICEILFYDCNDIKCLCCDSKLLYKSDTSIVNHQDKLEKRRIKLNIKKLGNTTWRDSPAWKKAALTKEEKKDLPRSITIEFDKYPKPTKKLTVKQLQDKRNGRIKKLQYNISVWREHIFAYERKKNNLPIIYRQNNIVYPCLNLVIKAIDERIQDYKEKINKLNERKIKVYHDTCFYQYEEWHKPYHTEDIYQDLMDGKISCEQFDRMTRCKDCQQIIRPIPLEKEKN